MNFCQECNNVLYPKELREEKKLMLECRTCNAHYEPKSNCIFVHTIKELEVIANRDDKFKRYGSDKTLYRTNAYRCPKCSKHEAVYHQEEDNENVVLYVICANCGYVIAKGNE